MSAYDRRKLGAAKFGALAMGAVALGCAALAAFFVGNMLKAKGYTGDRVTQIVVAKHELRAAQPITAEDLQLINWPVKSVPEGAFGTIEQLFDKDLAPVPSTGILKGEPVVRSRLSTTKTGTGIARLIRPNMRAVALKVDDAIGYTGMVYPGAIVDVVVTIKDPLGRGPSSRIAVQRVRVLTVGAETDVATRRNSDNGQNLSGRQSSGGTYVTLEVAPDDAEVLAIAHNEGELTLALRNGADDATVETGGATPVQIGAYAVADDQDVELLAAAVPVASKSSRSSRSSSRAARPRKERRIQLRASDASDTPSKHKPAARIETYHAR